MAQEQVNVIFQPSGRRGTVPRDISIIEASRRIGVDIKALCGETRVCGKCMVRIEEGHFEKYNIHSGMDHVSPWQEEVEEKFITPEQRAKGFRLGCVAKIQDDILVFVPEESRAGKQVVSKAARDINIEFNPAVRLYTISLKPPDFEDKTAEFERLTNGLAREFGLTGLTCDILKLRTLPGAMNFFGLTNIDQWVSIYCIKLKQAKITEQIYRPVSQ